MTHPFATIEHAIHALRQGRMIILVDALDRKKEGQLVVALEHANDMTIDFMTQYGRGPICIARDEKAADILEHLATFPIYASIGPVSTRKDPIEASVFLARLAGLKPAAVLCEMVNEDEDEAMSFMEALDAFSKRHHISILSIEDLIHYQITHENLIEPVSTVRLPTHHFGEFAMTLFSNQLDQADHLALVKQPLAKEHPTLVRIHSECITGDVFGSSRCDCGAQLDIAMQRISDEGGIIIYLRQEGRGIGLSNKLKAYVLQEQGYDTAEANECLGLPIDSRDYAVGYQILKYFGINTVKLLTNNPHKVQSLEKYGIKVSERISLITKPTDENHHYLRTKQEKMGHFLQITSPKKDEI